MSGLFLSGKKFVQLVCWPVGDDGQGVFEPGERLDIIDFAACQQGVDHGSVLCGFMRSGKEIVLTTQSYRTD